MRNIGMNSKSRNTVKDWVRIAAKVGLLFTEPKVRAAVGSQIRDTVDDLTDKTASKYEDLSDTVASKYEDAVDRLENAADAIRGKDHWPSRVTGFLLGVGSRSRIGNFVSSRIWQRDSRIGSRCSGGCDEQDSPVGNANAIHRHRGINPKPWCRYFCQLKMDFHPMGD
jgi:hypothetical protein